MGSQYDRIDDVEAQLEPQAKLNSASTNLTASNTNANSNTGQKKAYSKMSTSKSRMCAKRLGITVASAA